MLQGDSVIPAAASALDAMTVQELIVWIVCALLAIVTARFLVYLLWPYSPRSPDEVRFRERAKTQQRGPVRVTVSALSHAESRALFGVPLGVRGIQPVWIEVANGDRRPLYYLRAGTDPMWFSPHEAYWLTRFRAPRRANERLADRFYALEFRNPVPPGETRSGFVFTRIDEGSKAIDLDLVAFGETVYSFSFTVMVPGFRGDSQKVDFAGLYPPGDIADLDSEAALRDALERLPACTTNRAGDRQGDPLNLILIGARDDTGAAFSRRGWHPTEQTYAAAVWRTLRSFLFRSPYRYSPVSPLYVFGRRQDVSAQKARGSISLRNHARFWLTPLRYRGTPVWIGQISRDIGVRMVLGFPPTTHLIDPDVDEARQGLLQDLAYSQALAKFAYVKGVGAAPRATPRGNLTNDPYFTDGLRAVMFFDKRPMTLDKVAILEWELPPSRAPEQRH